MAGPKRSSTTSKSSNASASGKRGVGRPPLGGDPMSSYNVMLDRDTAVGLRNLGVGNLSRGIRVAFEMLRARR